MAKKVLKIIFSILEIVLVIIVASLYYLATPVQLDSSQLHIPAGNINHTILYLNDHGIPTTKIDALILSRLGQPQRGWIDLGTERMSRLDFLYRLTHSKAPLISIKLIPGETTFLFLEQLHKEYGYPLDVLRKEYEKVTPYPEGVLFPDTYYLPKGMEAKELIDYLVGVSLQKHKRLAQKVYRTYDPKLWFEKVVTIASIIQKEAADTKEMLLIASVIYNRLKKGIPLQMDGTLNYGRYSHTKVTHKRIKEDKSAFNTYRHKGLPPYPVCTVSLEAIKAALRPAKTKYLYFVKGANGRHIFSSTYKNHLKNIKTVKKRNKKE